MSLSEQLFFHARMKPQRAAANEIMTSAFHYEHKRQRSQSAARETVLFLAFCAAFKSLLCVFFNDTVVNEALQPE